MDRFGDFENFVITNKHTYVFTESGNILHCETKNLLMIEPRVTGNYIKMLNSLKLKLIGKVPGNISFASKLTEDKLLLSFKNQIRMLKKSSEGKNFVMFNIAKTNKEIWRLLVINRTMFISTSKYGELLLWKKHSLNWKSTSISYSEQSIFCIDKFEPGSDAFLTSDYRGLNSLWKFDKNSNLTRTEIRPTSSNMQRVVIIDKNTFAMNNFYGEVFIFEKNVVTAKFNISDLPEGGLVYFKPKKELIYGSHTSIVFLNPETYAMRRLNLELEKRILNLQIFQNRLFAITKKEILMINLDAKAKTIKKIENKYYKVAILGQTGVGKSTLCSVLHEKYTQQLSSHGRTIWELVLKKSGRPILMHDIAGQNTQLYTSFANLANSDLIFVLFKKTHNETFKEAKSIISELKLFSSEPKNIHLIMTHADHDLEAYDTEIDEFIEEESLPNRFVKISMTEDEQTNIEVIHKIINSLDNRKAQTVISTLFFEDVLETLEEKRENCKKKGESLILKLDEFRAEMKTHFFTDLHLAHLMNYFSETGKITYLKESKEIIIHDHIFNQLQTVIPILLSSNNGIITQHDLRLKLYNLSKDNYKNYKLKEKANEITKAKKNEPPNLDQYLDKKFFKVQEKFSEEELKSTIDKYTDTILAILQKNGKLILSCFPVNEKKIIMPSALIEPKSIFEKYPTLDSKGSFKIDKTKFSWIVFIKEVNVKKIPVYIKVATKWDFVFTNFESTYTAIIRHHIEQEKTLHKKEVHCLLFFHFGKKSERITQEFEKILENFT